MKRLAPLACLALLHCHPEAAPPARAPTRPVAGSTTTADPVRAPDPAPTPPVRDVSRPIGRGTLAGTIRDTAGNPLAGARACARDDQDSLRDFSCTLADARGGYRLDVAEGRYIVDAMAPTYVAAPYKRGSDSSLYVGAGTQQQGLDIALASGGAEVSGRVTDLSGAPIVNARIVARAYWNRNGAAFTETDATGHYSVWMGRGDVRVVVAWAGEVGAAEMGTAPGVIDLRVGPAPDAVITGRVIDDASGAPIAGIHVEATSRGGPIGGTKSDARGEFRVTNLSGGRYGIMVRDAGLISLPSATLVAREGQTTPPVIVRVRPAARVTGKLVIDEAGTPCASGRVSVTDERDIESTASADPAGAVVFSALAPGTYRVHAYCHGYRGEEKSPPLVVAGTDVSGVVWRFAPGVTLTGRVRSRAGKAIAGAWISVHGEDTASVDAGNAVSLPDGTYAVTGLAPGTYQVEITNDVGGVAPTKVTIGARAVVKDLVVSPLATVRGLVVDSRGQPVPRAAVRLENGDRRLGFTRKTRTFSGPDGTFEFRSFPPGAYTVRLEVPWHREETPAPEAAVVVRGTASPKPVKLVLVNPGGTIHGTVVDASGAKVRNARVSTAWSAEVRTRADGRFSLERLVPGKHTVLATRDGILNGMAKDVDLGADITLVIPDPAAVEGSVALADGTVPDDIVLEVTPGYFTEVVPVTGRFVITGLEPGRITITARAGTATGRVELDVPAGATKRGVAIVVK